MSKLLHEEKALTLPCRNCIKTERELDKAIVKTQQKYKDIIFGNDPPVCKECLNQLKNQQVIDGRVYYQNHIENAVRKLAYNSLQKNIVMDGDMMIDLSPEVHYTCCSLLSSRQYKDTFLGQFNSLYRI